MPYLYAEATNDFIIYLGKQLYRYDSAIDPKIFILIVRMVNFKRSILKLSNLYHITMHLQLRSNEIALVLNKYFVSRVTLNQDFIP